ncbi:hypothetical protein [Cupriavidus basilensis]|uniref:hypothetical protein n=1 Tax=Cupriavidus basilensis TaxID=68895 RepID=UPI00284EB5C9|nr:hypothetical protein [Cupriavidus basilensis]MDR3383936.1 hypothetical protein [Cupriavidus basilensis]
MIKKNIIDTSAFNKAATLPFELRISDFEHAMQDVYDFFSDVNALLSGKGFQRLDDMIRPAMMSGLISDMITASLAKFSRALVENQHFNGHPDLIVRGVYANNSIASGTEGIEIKSTRKPGGAVDTHGARQQWMCVFVYEVDNDTEPASDRLPMQFTEVYIAQVDESDFRKNARGELGTRTATLHANGVKKLRANWVYKIESLAAARKTALSVAKKNVAPAAKKQANKKKA